MASKQVITKSKPLLNPVLRNSSMSPNNSLLPKTNHPFLVLKSSEMTQATTISPTGVQPQSRTSGPCRSPTLTCPPPPCACPQPEVITIGTRIWRLLWFLTKLGIFVGAVKFTIDEGLWGSSEETADLAKRMGIITDDKNAKKEETKSSIRSMWNNMVLKVGEFFGMKP